MKKIFIAASILLLAASCSKQPTTVINYPTPTPTASVTPTPDPTANWNTYNSPAKTGFSIKYPSDFGFSTDLKQVQGVSYIPVCDQNMVACAYLIRDTFKATNFDGAGVSVNIDPTLNTQAKCYNFAVATNAAQTPAADVTINGVVFKAATGGDAGAGHFDNVKVYRNFNNGMCYEIAAHVGSTNIGNYPTGTVSQFDENAVWDKLQGVVNTFEFTNNLQSNSGWTLASGNPDDACTSPTFSGSVLVHGWYAQSDVPYNPGTKAWYLFISSPDISKLPLQNLYQGVTSVVAVIDQPDTGLVTKLKAASESKPQGLLLKKFVQYCEGYPTVSAVLPPA